MFSHQDMMIISSSLERYFDDTDGKKKAEIEDVWRDVNEVRMALYG